MLLCYKSKFAPRMTIEKATELYEARFEELSAGCAHATLVCPPMGWLRAKYYSWCSAETILFGEQVKAMTFRFSTGLQMSRRRREMNYHSVALHRIQRITHGLVSSTRLATGRVGTISCGATRILTEKDRRAR